MCQLCKTHRKHEGIENHNQAGGNFYKKKWSGKNQGDDLQAEIFEMEGCLQNLFFFLEGWVDLLWKEAEKYKPGSVGASKIVEESFQVWWLWHLQILNDVVGWWIWEDSIQLIGFPNLPKLSLLESRFENFSTISQRFGCLSGESTRKYTPFPSCCTFNSNEFWFVISHYGKRRALILMFSIFVKSEFHFSDIFFPNNPALFLRFWFLVLQVISEASSCGLHTAGKWARNCCRMIKSLVSWVRELCCPVI